jgi:phosphoribosylanthranilate isomerase
MINGIRIKVCGVTTLIDAEAADAGGADFLGFNLYKESPRFVSMEQWKSMLPNLPDRKKVAVSVVPRVDELKAMVDAGFDLFQIHFPPETPVEMVEAWSNVVDAARLWIAPKLPPGEPFRAELLPFAGSVLWDAFAKDKFGGTGHTSDWAAFRVERESHQGRNWILAGGLSPDNISAALAATGAKIVDVNSGVETSPGIKNPDKLRAFFEAIAGRA